MSYIPLIPIDEISLAESFYSVKYGLSNITSFIPSNYLFYFKSFPIFFLTICNIGIFLYCYGFNLVEKVNICKQQLNIWWNILIHIWKSRKTLLLPITAITAHSKHLYFNLLWRIEIGKIDLVWRWFGNPESWIFHSWSFDLVKSNIPVLHSLSSKGWQKSLFKNFFFENKNKVVLAIWLLILRLWFVLKALATSTSMITSMTLMASTASLASKNQKQHAIYILSDFPSIRNLSGLNDLNSLSGLNNLFSLILSKQLLSLMFPSTLAPRWHILVF